VVHSPVRPQSEFPRPDQQAVERRAQAPSRLAAGHRRRRREAALTARARRYARLAGTGQPSSPLGEANPVVPRAIMWHIWPDSIDTFTGGLWGMPRNESPRHDQRLVFAKVVVKSAGGGIQVYALSPAKPFARLRNDALLDTTDLCDLFGCSTRSIYRWMSGRKLPWRFKVGREYLFRKDDVLDWYDDNLPALGRPPTRRR